MEPFDLVVKNVRVVRHDQAEPAALDIGVRDGRVARLAPTIDRHRREGRRRRRRQARLPRRRRRPPALGHLPPARRGRRDREPRLRAGRRHHRAQLHAHRAVLPQPRRTVRASSSRRCCSATDGKSYVDYAFHLAPMTAEHIDEIPELIERPRRHLVQDLHVLRRPRPARPLDRPELLPDDPAGRALRLRALRVRHARRAGRPRAVPRPGRRDLAVAALRDGRDHAGVHPAWSRRTAASPGWRPTAPPGRRTPRAWRSPSPPTSPTRPACPPSTCCT